MLESQREREKGRKREKETKKAKMTTNLEQINEHAPDSSLR